MSERAKIAEKNYFRNIPGSNLAIGERHWFTKGYEQAEKDMIEMACEFLSQYHVDLDKFRKAMEGDNSAYFI